MAADVPSAHFERPEDVDSHHWCGFGPDHDGPCPPLPQEPLGTCIVHGDYWTDYCLRCGW